MTVFPLKFKPFGAGYLFADDAGGYFKADAHFLNRYATGKLTALDRGFLEANGHAFNEIDDPAYMGFAYRWAQRLHRPQELNYVILVPTLRCNLACAYCQVSRVNESTPGFDWTDETLERVLRFLDAMTSASVKIEFQGGEPLLRLDLLEKVRDFARRKFQEVFFTVCTNLQSVSEEAWDFLDASDVFVSTSLDGEFSTHERQRTVNAKDTQQFVSNLSYAIERLGQGKVSALPTLDINQLPSVSEIIDTFGRFGFRSIFLRPVNHQGFARKRFQTTGLEDKWNAYHADFIDALIEDNWTAGQPVEEFYFTHCLRRVLRGGHNQHVDLRNPNILGRDYIVIDYDGTFYPTDEARMVTRVGQVDLSIGNLCDGIDQSKLDVLNQESSNSFHPDCIHCPYQAACGADVVDDLSRYGRIDLPKADTAFCRRHTAIFDKIFELLYSADEKVQKSLAFWAGIPEFDPSLAPVHT
ncbi:MULTISPECIES: His-Xaa-Ser system radical SAM maturase HxsB [Rhizobium]|uniref:His-Xaa-Ser system radical SAM maturase HxsB n=3 Tax=Rhizobium TaxID=379 RepID=A0A6P1CIP6_RHITR|nr:MULTISPECIES: His-Xaa-Ser system radical SAM maturase HxsB [Rhizobium]AGB73684.1 radical SAM superfamily protein [Rhizobium tropici CIAT 899]ENN85784.1 radical SAM superfamily protein [Rhizobium freirei PRF 81]MBB4245215.1 His-Xaa-Ser system radical SAM maturase HxsB [Rhizobium tropici]MBB5596521.1 His-Xaa-Ser system radical SAM maturase HxsB [Rhizobium tropici]MBB6489249.1 His-Xaa-Ser system radical SAM maturase HxsB [Rhizobium lusitanum]